MTAWHYARHLLFGLRSSFLDKHKAVGTKLWGCLDPDCDLNANAPEWVKDVLRKSR